MKVLSKLKSKLAELIFHLSDNGEEDDDVVDIEIYHKTDEHGNRVYYQK